MRLNNFFHSKAEAENIGIKNRLDYAESSLAGPADTTYGIKAHLSEYEVRDHSAITRNKHKASRFKLMVGWLHAKTIVNE